jgi:predicted DNA-binding protein
MPGRTKTVSVVLPEEAYEALAQLARQRAVTEEQGVSPSDLIREALEKAYGITAATASPGRPRKITAS